MSRRRLPTRSAERWTALGADAEPASVARLLADGRDADLEVQWRLVDGDGRPIVLDLGRAAKRTR